MRTNVYIDPKCLATSIVPAALEEYHKEVSGYLIGSNGSKARELKIVSAYSLQTDNKNPTWVEHGNFSAVERVEGLMKTMNIKLVGGFHSHPDGPNKLSRSDIDFVTEKLEEHSLASWLELIVSVKRKEYTSKQRVGWLVREHLKKLSLRIRTSPSEGFDLTLSGFWVLSGKKIREARLWTSQRYNF